MHVVANPSSVSSPGVSTVDVGGGTAPYTVVVEAPGVLSGGSNPYQIGIPQGLAAGDKIRVAVTDSSSPPVTETVTITVS